MNFPVLRISCLNNSPLNPVLYSLCGLSWFTLCPAAQSHNNMKMLEVPWALNAPNVLLRLHLVYILPVKSFLSFTSSLC